MRGGLCPGGHRAHRGDPRAGRQRVGEQTRSTASSASSRSQPQHQVYLQSSRKLPRHLEFDLTGRFVNRLSGFAPVVDSYFSLDARLGWQLRKDLEIVVAGQNLLDSHHPESGTAPLLRSLLVEVERGVYGKVTWRF
jgi:iron complex outermembrane recepter protein